MDGQVIATPSTPLFAISQWYNLSKTLAEEAAWEFAKQNGIDLITLHPVVVIGPFLQPTLRGCAQLHKTSFEENGFPNIGGTSKNYRRQILEFSVKDSVESLVQKNFLKILPQN